MSSARRASSRSLAKIHEVALAAPQVVALRTARLLEAAASPSAADRTELTRMCTEKVRAYWSGLFGMGGEFTRASLSYASRAGMQWWRLWLTPWWLAPRASHASAVRLLAGPTASERRRTLARVADAALAPVHQAATANVRRLTRTKRRR